MCVTYVHLHIYLHTRLHYLHICYLALILAYMSALHTYIHFLFETDIIPKKTKQYMKTALNLGKKAIYLFALVGLFQKTEMTNGCQAFQQSEWIIRGDVFPLGGYALVKKKKPVLRIFKNEARKVFNPKHRNHREITILKQTGALIMKYHYKNDRPLSSCFTFIWSLWKNVSRCFRISVQRIHTFISVLQK